MAFNQRFAGLRLREQGADLNQFEKDFLAAHNTYRKQHGVPPLQLSRELCRSAQKWADNLLSIRTLKHSGTEYGENLFYKYSSSARELAGHVPVESWYSEIKNYNFSNPGFGGNTGHFTQVIWKDSREVGVGLATDGNGLFFVVGQYNPAGNITNPGFFEMNVLPSGAAPASDNVRTESRWKPGGSKEPEPDKTFSDRKPLPVFGKQGAEESQFENDFLSAHNTYRKKHGASPLQLNRDLCRSAQEWANHLLSIRTLKHSGTDNGENLFYKYSSSARELPGNEPVDSWYDEIKNYDFNRAGFRSNTGHFTQVVWKDSREVGVGLATDGNGLFFVVGQYNPAGNITNPGYFEKNVLPSGTAPAPDNVRTESRWKPGGSKEPEPDKTFNDRKPVPVFSKRAGASTFEQDILETHNMYRHQHGVPPLQLSRELSESSQKWADHLLSINALQHSNTTHGENLWYKWNSSMRDASGTEVVDTWYGEIKDYNFSNPGFQSNTGHFTQVVWKDSRELGIAKAVDGKGMVIAVAQYSPAGNITNPGYFQKNVLPKGTPVSEGGAGSSDKGTTGSFYPPTRVGDSASSTTVDSKDFALEFLKANNTYRSRHGAKPLQLNSRISQEAQKWAEHLLTLKTLKHSDTSYGENIWAKTGGPSTTVTGQEVADSWYKEEKNYNFSKPGYQSDTGHFTQMVWKVSKEVGIGLASSGKGMFIVVAQYNPSGNITNPGFYANNVLTRGSKVTDEDDDEDGFVKNAGANAIVIIPEKDLKAFRKELLNEHNKYRRLHGSGGLQLSTTLSQEAQKWAEHLVGMRALQNSNTQHGENLWYRWGTDTSLPTGTEVAESWYDEIAKYSFSSPGFQGGSGNFTQMIWKASSQVGFGLGTDSRGMYIAVGFYDPAGNIANKGYFEDNVLPKKK